MSETFANLDDDPRRLAVGLWVRRGVLALLAVVVLAALLNRFGQRPMESTARVPAATVRLTAPETVRGGLFFQSRLDIRAVSAIDHPRLVLEDGWLEGMQVNSIEPDPSQQASRNGTVVLEYDPVQAGQRLVVWLQFQANPASSGRRSYYLELDDGSVALARIDRTITVFP